MTNDEYEQLKKFWITFKGDEIVTYGDGRKMTALEILQDLESGAGITRAKQGLRQGVNDIVAEYARASPGTISEIDAQMITAGCVTFSALKNRFSSEYKKILKREIIENESEYYLMKNVLCDFGSTLTKTEAQAIGSMLGQFEKSGQEKTNR
jgi:hypothetical protein